MIRKRMLLSLLDQSPLLRFFLLLREPDLRGSVTASSSLRNKRMIFMFVTSLVAQKSRSRFPNDILLIYFVTSLVFEWEMAFFIAFLFAFARYKLSLRHSNISPRAYELCF